jgi:ABC-type multidrug transport system fused ATPase/permease subunit
MNAEYAMSNLFSIDGFEIPYFCCIFLFTMFLVSILRYVKIKEVKFIGVSSYKLDDLSEPQKLLNLDNENLFLAFHNVYFQDPTELSDKPVLNNISFSVLPGEFVSITGELACEGSYIFELILKYYVPQAGKIYLSGQPLNDLGIRDVRSLIGIFKENFGIIQGTVYDNLAMLTDNEREILTVTNNIGLSEEINKLLFDENGNLDVRQDVLFRIQAARISIQKPKLMLIETPPFFESDFTKNMFYDFVEHISKRNTVIMITNEPKTTIYSNKILYMGIGKFLFGSHAELAKDFDYQNYIKNQNQNA